MRRARRERSFELEIPRRRSTSTSEDREYTITCTLGSFVDVKISWEGASALDVRASFTEWLWNDAEFDTFRDRPGWRTVDATFQGQAKSVTFRTDWVAGFAVYPAR